MGNYIDKFKADVDSVRILMDFDTVLLEVTKNQLNTLSVKFKNASQQAEQQIKSCADSINNIKNHESLRAKYSQIYNSCLVLLVAYFSSVLRDAFSDQLQKLIEGTDESDALEKTDFNFKVEDFRKYGFNLKNDIGSILTEQMKISFQDMQSICRAFLKYLAVDIPQDRNANNIIVAQAARHIIVHSDGRINKKFLSQTKKIPDRDFLSDIKENERIQLTKENIELVISEMEKFLLTLESKISIGE